MADQSKDGKSGSRREAGWEVTAELLARYDRPGPRYTSYPTALEFHEGVDAAACEAKLAEADAKVDEPLSMYIHLPFCEERCEFCGCNVIISPDKSRAIPYLGLLRREMELLAERLPRRRKLSQLHFGGGTPTYYSPEQLTALLEELFSYFTPVEGAELAVEADPRVTGEDHVAALAGMGFNRISFGVQDFTPEVQRAIGRVQSVEETEEFVKHSRKHGYAGINIDLIYGLPYQKPSDMRRTVDTVIEMGADRAAVYSFAYVPGMHGNMRKLPAEALPGRDEKFALFAIARERFLEAGYVPIGMDHFARPEDELAIARREGRLMRNFQGYTVVPAEDVVALGISGIGDVAGAYVQNFKKLSRYETAIGEGRLPVQRGVVLSDDDLLRRAVIRELMCNFAVDMAGIEADFDVDFTEYFAEDLALLDEHVEAGMVEVGGGRIRITELGELFVRNLAMCFDRYQREERPEDKRKSFSRTV